MKLKLNTALDHKRVFPFYFLQVYNFCILILFIHISIQFILYLLFVYIINIYNYMCNSSQLNLYFESILSLWKKICCRNGKIGPACGYPTHEANGVDLSFNFFFKNPKQVRVGFGYYANPPQTRPYTYIIFKKIQKP